MPIDPKSIKWDAPDPAAVKWDEPDEAKALGASRKQTTANMVGGAIRGAGSIGASILAPIDATLDYMNGKGFGLESNRERRKAMDEGLTSLIGSDQTSGWYQGMKTGTEVAGTLGVGGAVANVAARVPGLASAAPGVINAVRTGGMTAGPAGGMVPRVVGGAITGGASAGLINPQDAKTGALIGGALPAATKAAGMVGEGIGSAAKAGVRAIAGQASPEVASLAKRAADLGIDIPADRLVNSKPLDAVASALNYVPFSGRAATERRMGEQLNQAASRLMGQDTPNINLAIRKAGQELGAKFETTLQNTGVKFDKQLLTDVSDVFNRAEKELGSDALKAISSQVDDLVAKGSSGVIDGQAAYNIKRTLDRIGNRNGPEAWHAIELKKVLMDGLNRSLGPTEAAAFAQTRQQYGNMMALEKIAKNGVEGELSIARLANIKNINNDGLQELADIAAQFVKAREGQHGAMQRAIAGGATFATAGLPGVLAGAAAGRSVNAGLNSQAARNLLTGAVSQPNALQRLLSNSDLAQLGYRVAPNALSGP